MLVVYPDAVWYTYVDRARHRRDHRPSRRQRRDRRAAAHLTPKTTRARDDRRARRRARGRAQRSRRAAARHRAGRASASAAGRHARQQGRADARQDVLRAGLRRRALQFPRRRRSRPARSTTASAKPTTRSPRSPTRATRFGEALPVVLAGFSFGTFVQTRVAQRGRARSASCWSVPRSAASPSRRVPADTIVIHGEEDDVVPLADVFAWARPQAAAGRRVPRLRPFLPRPAAATAARRSPACGSAGPRERLPDALDAARRAAADRAQRRDARRRARASRACASATASNEVVRGLSSTIRRGECFGLLGPNGAGKTTTLRCCLGLIDPDGGTIEMVGEPVPQGGARGAHPRRRRAADGQPRSRLHRAPRTCVIYGRYFGIARATLDERIPRLLDFAGLAEQGATSASARCRAA